MAGSCVYNVVEALFPVKYVKYSTKNQSGQETNMNQGKTKCYVCWLQDHA